MPYPAGNRVSSLSLVRSSDAHARGLDRLRALTHALYVHGRARTERRLYEPILCSVRCRIGRRPFAHVPAGNWTGWLPDLDYRGRISALFHNVV